MGKLTTGVAPRAAWTLPAAGLLLGAPWIKPWFADPADLSGKGVTFWLGPIKVGTFGSAPTDTASWARIATSDGYALFSGTQALGLLSLVFGLFVLYGYLAGGRSPRWARAAVILGVASIVPAMMQLGVQAFADPAVAGLYQKGVDTCPIVSPELLSYSALCRWHSGPFPSILGDPLGGGALALAFTALELASVIALGGAIWRSGLLPKWVALPFAVAYVGCIEITPVLTLIGGFLMIVAGGWIAFHASRGSAINLSPAGL
jgi:hypothetical protein